MGATEEQVERWDRSSAKTERIGEKLKKLEAQREEDFFKIMEQNKSQS